MVRHRRMLGISKATSQALRRRKLEGMDDQGWAAIETVRDLPRLFELRTTMGDSMLILNWAGGIGKDGVN